MIKKIRSLDKKPKRILFVGIVGSVWFFGMENWFRRTGGGINLDGTTYTYDVKDWEGVFLTTFVTAFFCYWLLYGLRKKNMKRSVTITHKKKMVLYCEIISYIKIL